MKILITIKYLKRLVSDIYQYRSLLHELVNRDIKVKYKQTVLGLLWIVLQPLVTSIIMVFIFSRFLGNMATPGNGSYMLSVLSGMLFWSFFSSGVLSASNSYLNNENLIKKVYFPKLILPMSGIVSQLFDFAVNSLLFLFIFVVSGYSLNYIQIIVLIACLLLVFVYTISVSIICASLVTFKKDFRHVVPFLVQLGFFLSPIFYSFEIFGSLSKLVAFLNPISIIIIAFRSTLWQSDIFAKDEHLIYLALISIVLMFGLSVEIYRRTEKKIVDLI